MYVVLVLEPRFDELVLALYVPVELTRPFEEELLFDELLAMEEELMVDLVA